MQSTVGPIISHYNSLVIWSHSPNMSRAVHKPREMQCHHVAQGSSNVTGIRQFLADHEVRNQRWNNKGKSWHQHDVVSDGKWNRSHELIWITFVCVCKRFSLFLEHNDCVLFQIGHRDVFPFCLHIRMLPQHQPTHVREKETAFRIMRVGICIGVFMMHPMISNPFMNAVLECNQIRYGQKESQLPLCFVRFVCPESMRTRCYAERSNRTVRVTCRDPITRNESFFLSYFSHYISKSYPERMSWISLRLSPLSKRRILPRRANTEKLLHFSTQCLWIRIESMIDAA